MDIINSSLERFNNWQNDNLVLKDFFYWIRHESNIKTLKLDIDNNLFELKKEILPLLSISTDHRSDESAGWRSATLYGYSSIMTESDEHYHSQGIKLPIKKRWTSLSYFFPKTKEWILKNIPFTNFGRIRIMIVEPGGYVLPHKDFPNGSCLAGVNVAICHPTEVKYVVGGEEVVWKEGDSRLIDIGSIHEIQNHSNDPRVHLIIHSDPIDQWSNEMMKIVCKSFILENKKWI